MAGKEIRPSLMLKAFAASLLTFLVAGMAQTAPAAPAAPLDREFRYRPDDFSLHWRGEAVQVDSRLGNS
jgi:hypothetical protein